MTTQVETPASPPSVGGTVLGLVAVCVLHVLASLASILIGGAVAKDGEYAVFFLWLGIGLLQWIYLYPALRIARASGWPGVVRGIWLGGALTLSLNLLQIGCVAMSPLKEKITGNSAPNSYYSGADGHVVSSDANHIVVREGLAELGNVSADTVTFVVTPETRFDFEGPAWRKQPRAASLAWLKAGHRVRVDYFVKDRQKHARLVAIWVETPEP